MKYLETSINIENHPKCDNIELVKTSDQDTNVLEGLVGDDFRIIKRFAIGSFTKVYIAIQESVPQRKVAIKVMHEMHIRKSKNAPLKLKREAYYLGMMKSPCFPRVLMTGITNDGLPFLAMEYIEGPNVNSIIRDQRKIPYYQVIDLAVELCEGVEEMHGRGILHRDIKPANLALEQTSKKRTHLRILDLGSAAPISDCGPHMKDGEPVIVGTPAYLAPEQFIDGSSSIQTDIYQMSATLYEMLTGIKVIRIKQKDLQGYMEYAISNKPLPTYPIGDIQPDVPHEFELVIEKGLARNPDHRWKNATEYMNALLNAAQIVAERKGKHGTMMSAIRHIIRRMGKK